MTLAVVSNLKNSLKGKTPIQLLGFWGVLAVDFFSLNHFFRLQGTSWILWILPTIFVFVKVWHWVEFFQETRRGKKALHFVAWLVLSILSLFSFINLGLAITEVAKVEKSVVQTATDDALAKAKLTQVTSLTTERANLSYAVTTAEQKKAKTGTWGEESQKIRTQLQSEISASNTRIKEIDETLKTFSSEAKTENDTAVKEKAWYDVEPIGVNALMSQLIPALWVHAATVIMFLIVGLAMELTLALTSLPEKAPPLVLPSPKEETVTEEKEVDTQTANTEGFNQYAARLYRPSKIEDTPIDNPKDDPSDTKKVVYVGRPALPRLLEYIDLVYPEDSKRLTSNEAIVDKGFSMEESNFLRKYLASLRFKGTPLIESSRGGTWPHMTKANMKKLVEFFDSTEREETADEGSSVRQR